MNPQLALIASLAGNIAAVVAVPWLAVKLADARQELQAIEATAAILREAVAEMRPNYERGKRSRLQAARALAKANQANRERREAEKVAAEGVGG